jgi:hypothetical protein
MKKYFPFFPKANQRALKDCKEQFGNSSSNWTSPEWEAGRGSNGGRNNARAKGKDGERRNIPGPIGPRHGRPAKMAVSDKMLELGMANVDICRFFWGRATKGKCLKNWKNINFSFSPKKADQRAQKKSLEELGHSSSNLASGPWEGIIGAKKKQSTFNWESSSNAGDSDSGSDDCSNSDSNASANSKNGGKKKKADGNVNVHICGCCIFI